MPPLRSALILLGAAAVFWSCAGREDTPALPDAHAAPAVAAPPAWAVGQRPTAMLLVGYAAFVAHLGPDVSDGLRGGGWIGSYGPDGQLTDTLVAGLDAPRALAAVRDVLYVLDGSRVLGVRTDDGTPAATVDLSGVTPALTALCPAPDGTLFVVSEQAGRVWRVDPGAGAVVPIATLASVSGVDFDAKAERLYLSTSASGTGAGQLYTMAADESTPAPLGGLRGDFSALVLRGDRLYASVRARGETADYVLSVSKDGTMVENATTLSTAAEPGQPDVLGGDLLFVPVSASGEIHIARLAPDR